MIFLIFVSISQFKFILLVVRAAVCVCVWSGRAMATCLILMFGRLGAVGGSNFVGILLDGHCELIFYLYGALIISKSTSISAIFQAFENSIIFYL